MATKTASPVVYLMEELGDARLRCDQLVRYIEEGTKLIEASPHKDMFFEVAGHLIHGVPQTVLKLQRALQAVALAAGRIDYEELKRILRPEKVKELERVLEDVRIRQIDRRGVPFQNMTRRQAGEELRGLALTLNETGLFPRHRMAQLIAALEVDTKTASVPDVADGFERLAEALEGPDEDEAPSRVLLASTLRRMLGDACAEDFQGEGQIMTTTADWKQDVDDEQPPETEPGGPHGKGQGPHGDGHGPHGKGHGPGKGKGPCKKSWQVATDDDKASRFEEGKPADPTKNMSPEEAKEWKANTEKHKDKFKKKEAGSEGLETAIGDIEQVTRSLDAIFRPARSVRAGKRGWGPGYDWQWRSDLYMFNVGVNVFGGKNAEVTVTKAPIRPGGDVDLGSLVEDSKMTHPEQAGAAALKLAKAIRRKTAATEEKDAKWKKDQKVPMDELTKGMSDEDAKKWKAENEKNRDKFKKDADWKADGKMAYISDPDYVTHEDWARDVRDIYKHIEKAQKALMALGDASSGLSREESSIGRDQLMLAKHLKAAWGALNGATIQGDKAMRELQEALGRFHGSD